MAGYLDAVNPTEEGPDEVRLNFDTGAALAITRDDDDGGYRFLIVLPNGDDARAHLFDPDDGQQAALRRFFAQE